MKLFCPGPRNIFTANEILQINGVVLVTPTKIDTYCNQLQGGRCNLCIFNCDKPNTRPLSEMPSTET